jgi:hypothetical protein
MFSCRSFGELLLFSAAALGGCHSAKPVVASLPSREADAAPPEPAARKTEVAPPPRARCAEGYKPSPQFVRKPWLDAYQVVKAASSVWVAGDAPTTAEQARDGLCLQTSGIVGMPPNLKSTCKGDYWVISTDHDYSTDHTFVIVPRGGEAIVFDAGLLGGELCKGEQSSTLSSAEVGLNGHFLRVIQRSESREWSPLANPGEECQPSRTDVADYTYDLKNDLGCEAFHVE